MKKIYILAGILIAFYIASPYYALFSLFKSLNDGDTVDLKKVVDFPTLRESLKDEMKSKLVQQTKQSISSKEEELADKLVSGMGAMFGTAIIDGLVDTFVTPSGLAGLISNPSAALNGKEASRSIVMPNISWAFFTGPTDFQAKINDKNETLTLHFRITDFRWMLYAITWRDGKTNLFNQQSKRDLPQGENSPNKPTLIGYWQSESIGYAIHFKDDGLIEDTKTRNLKTYDISNNGDLLITKGNKTSSFNLIQRNDEKIILSDVDNGLYKFNRISLNEFQSIKRKTIFDKLKSLVDQVKYLIESRKDVFFVDNEAIPAGDIGDIFIMKGFDGFSVPAQLSNLMIKSAGITNVDNQPVAVAIIADKNTQLIVFDPDLLEIDIPDDRWLNWEIDNYNSLAIKNISGMCFLIYHRGNLESVQEMLK